jgi:hypothetical protein
MVVSEDVRRLLQQRPFQPFRLHLTDGGSYDIRFPEINLLGKTFLIVGIPVPDDPDPVYESTVKVPLSWLARVEMLPANGPPVSR